MKIWQKWSLALLIVVLSSIFLIFVFSALFSLPTIQTSRSSPRFLSLKISGDIPEHVQYDSFSDILSDSRPTIIKYLAAIRQAKKDPAISGIILQPIGVEMGWGRLSELRDALTDFKNGGKRLVAYLEYAATKDYFLASVCDEIYLTPTGQISLLGILAEVTFLRDSFDKLGIKADFLHIGEYKTAAEGYTANKMSDPHREMLTSLIDDLYNNLTKNIAESREISLENVNRLVDQGLFNGQAAVAAGLADSVLYLDELKSHLSPNRNKYSQIEITNYLHQQGGGSSISSERIALIYVQGVIASGSSGYNPMMGEISGANTLNRYIQSAAKDNSVKAIIVRIQSPGGSGMASDIIWHELMLAKQKKPVIVSMSDVAASGGYYIAAAADTIVAQPMTITGSIGVLSGKFNLKGLYDKIGLKKEQIHRGKFANLYDDYHSFTQDEKKMLQEDLQKFYENFVDKVARNRSRPYKQTEKLARGRVWTGQQALENGLVDTLGNLTTALQIAKRMAGLNPRREVQIVIYPEKISILDQLLERQVLTRIEKLFSLKLESILDSEPFSMLFKNREILTLLPYQIIFK
jgi:protease-4